MANSKKPKPNAEQFPPKFHGLVLRLVGLIEGKGIDVAQPILSSGCPTLGLKQPKNAFFVFLG